MSQLLKIETIISQLLSIHHMLKQRIIGYLSFNNFLFLSVRGVGGEGKKKRFHRSLKQHKIDILLF